MDRGKVVVRQTVEVGPELFCLAHAGAGDFVCFTEWHTLLHNPLSNFGCQREPLRSTCSHTGGIKLQRGDHASHRR